MSGYAEKARGLYLRTRQRFPEDIVKAVALIKWAMARANREAGRLDPRVAEAIERAALELAEGRLGGIVVDVYQTGSGTGLNMNVNDVIARRASEILGERVHPNDHVNRGQSSNDVIPTAVRIASAWSALRVLEAVDELRAAIGETLESHGSLVKAGRTHLRDAMPVTLGLWLRSYDAMLETVSDAIIAALGHVTRVPLGGTAVGTGAGTTRTVAERALELLRDRTGLPLRAARPRSAAMRLTTDLLLLSGALRALAAVLWRMAQDVRLMFSGPVNGLNEIDLDLDLPGSSMMPGKKNPVTSESVMQAATRILGLDTTIAGAALLGELELGMGWPLTAVTLHEMSLLAAEAARGMAAELRRIRPHADRMKEQAMRSPALATLLAPYIGYEAAAREAEALLKGETLEKIAKRHGLDPEKLLREALGWEH